MENLQDVLAVITGLLGVFRYLPPAVRWAQERLEDNGLQAAMTRAETEMRIAAKLDAMGLHDWGFETRETAQKRPLRVLVKFEMYRRHNWWNLLTTLWPMGYFLSAAVVVASTANLPVMMDQILLVVGILLFALSVLLLLIWIPLRLFWFDPLLARALNDRTARLKLRWFQGGSLSDPNETLIP